MQLVKWEPQALDNQTVTGKVINHTALPLAKIAKHSVNAGATVVEYIAIKPTIYIIEKKAANEPLMTGDTFVILLFLLSILGALVIGFGINYMETANRLLDIMEKQQ